MFLRFVFWIVLLVSLGSGVAWAQDYNDPSWPNLVRTLVRFNALDLSDVRALDEYAIITDCDIYKAFYKDDFKWNAVRQALKQSIQMNIATFPMNYHYDVALQLDRYDFDAKLYRLTAKTTLRNVNTFVLYSVEGAGCADADVKLIPSSFRAVINTPIYLEGLPLADKDAQALLQEMNDDKNISHIIYARFNLRIVYIEPLHKIAGVGDAPAHYEQSTALGDHAIRLDVRLDSINFYADEKKTKLIYQYQP